MCWPLDSEMSVKWQHGDTRQTGEHEEAAEKVQAEWPGTLPWVSRKLWLELHFTLFFLLPYLALMKQESDKVYEEALQRIN